MKRITKFFLALLGLVAALGFGTVFISYRTMKKSVSHAEYTPYIQERINSNREMLKQFDPQPVSFESEDGTRLQGVLVIRKEARRNFLVCHGYRSAKEMMYEFARMFPESNMLFFDFRAHGQSEGNLVTLGYNEKRDVAAAFNFLQTDPRTKDLPIYGIGVSMGGVALLSAASKGLDFKGLVIDSAFARLEDQLAYAFRQRTGLPRYPFLPITLFLYEQLTGIKVKDVGPIGCAKKLQIPTLFIHAENDKEVPLSALHELYDAAQGPKELWIEGPCPHATICFEYKDQYTKKVNDFFAKHK